MLDKDFQTRRETLLNQLDDDSIAILVAAPEYLRNGDATYPYRQNSDFYYLTGLEEAEAVAVFAPKSEFGDYILFNRPKDPSKEQWDGYIAGQKDACELFGANHSFPFDELQQVLPKLMEGRQKLYYDVGKKHFDEIVIAVQMQLRNKVRQGVKCPTEILSLASLIHSQRLIKSEYELDLMRHAVNASVKGHINAIKAVKPGMHEYQLSAELMYEFQKNGCLYPAYNPIVGAGKNTCVLHYVKNNGPINAGDLILIDAGAEYQYYAADITRTFPASGKYSESQKLIYELVLQSQKAGLEQVKPGKPWIAAQEAIIKVLTEGLVELKILKGNVTDLIEQKAYLPFYMHNSGHWIGMDVHDVGTYKVNGKWRSLEAGIVLTVEPGLYIQAGMHGVDEKWWNIGVRIEDDVLVTENGYDVLSKDLPKEISDIEALMHE